MEQPELKDVERLGQLYRRRVVARGAPDAATCVSPEAILAVVRREGSEDERLTTLEHVMSCSACHREYEWLSAVDRAAIESGGVPAGAVRGAWWRARPLALAASLLLAVGLGLLVSRVLSKGPELERGGAGDIVLVSPPPDAAPAGPITFAWHALPEASGYVLEVQRPDGSVAFTDTTTDTTATLTEPSRVLPEAEYRWWVREATDGAEPRASAFRALRLSHR
jgi:hypothetical protein